MTCTFTMPIRLAARGLEVWFRAQNSLHIEYILVVIEFQLERLISGYLEAGVGDVSRDHCLRAALPPLNPTFGKEMICVLCHSSALSIKQCNCCMVFLYIELAIPSNRRLDATEQLPMGEAQRYCRLEPDVLIGRETLARGVA
jgi:hypothetical protein